MPSLWFVTPAYLRFELTDICLRQRRWVCDELDKSGIEASCVVIANDENLETARALGFETVEMPNKWLGKKFNAGYAAARRAGVDYVFAIGSDVWIDPVYFDVLPSEDEVRCSRLYTVFPPSGDRRGEMCVHWIGGVAFVWPMSMLPARPCEERIRYGCDTSTFQRRPEWAKQTFRVGHQLELVGFQSEDNQISRYDRLMRRHALREVTEQPFQDLYDFYPAPLVDEIRRHYAVHDKLSVVNDERISKPVRWDPAKIKGDRAELFVYDPKEDRWSRKKEGPNDGIFETTFPHGFQGRRHAVVIGSEGGLVNIEIEVG